MGTLNKFGGKLAFETDPNFDKIKQLWVERGRPAVAARKTTYKEFFDQYIKPLTTFQYKTFMEWRRERLDELPALDLVKARESSELLANALENPDLVSPEDMYEMANRMTPIIFFYAKQLMKEKIAEMIRNPNSLNKMTYREVIYLYNVIVKEEQKNRDLKIKEARSQTENAYTIFQMALQSGELTDEKLSILKERAQRNKERFLSRQQSNYDDKTELRYTEPGQAGVEPSGAEGEASIPREGGGV